MWCGLDVGKQAHYICAVDEDGQRLFDVVLSQDEASLREVFGRLAERGPVLDVVDQPNTIGALPVAVARALGLQVGYLPGLAMRRLAQASGRGQDRRSGCLGDRRDGADHAACAAPGRRG